MYSGLVMECDYREGQDAGRGVCRGDVHRRDRGDSGARWRLAGRAALRHAPETDRSHGRGHPVDRLRAAGAGRGHRRPHDPPADRHRGQRPAAVSPHPHRRGGRHRRPDQPGPPRLRRRAQRLSAGPMRVRHSLQREPRTLPGIARRHSQGLDAGGVLAHREIFRVSTI